VSYTINVDQSTISLNIADEDVKLNVDQSTITLDVASGGLVPISDDLTLVAGENLSALRAVTTNSSGQAVYASNNTLANAQVVGIVYTAASLGANVTIKISGILTDANWNWTKGTVYLGTNGTLTQTVPTGGAIVVHVGKALTATQLIIDIDTIIQTV
jgi:hypothetical protein